MKAAGSWILNICLTLCLSPAFAYGQVRHDTLSRHGSPEDRPGERPDQRALASSAQGLSSPDETGGTESNEESRHEISNEKSPPSNDPSSGQSGRFALGGKIGLNFATFGGPDADREASDGTPIRSTYKLGTAINAFARFKLAHHWGIQTELAYTTKGSGLQFGDETREPFDFSYIELAALAHTRWPLRFIHEQVAFHGVLGVSTAYAFYIGQGDNEFTMTDRVDIGLHAGIGLSIELPYGNPILEARYYHGLLDPFFDASGLDESHRTFSILLGYEVPLGRSSIAPRSKSAG